MELAHSVPHYDLLMIVYKSLFGKTYVIVTWT